jgi:hypothetical protein
MGFKRKKYKHEYKSNSEYEAAQQLHKHKIKFVYEKEKLPFEWREDKNYIPDFFLPNGVILEVKGRFMPEDRKKHLFIKSQYPDLDIRFVFDNPYRKLYKGGKMTYADWCDKHGYMYCKLNEGIPQSWLDKQGGR